MESVWGENLNYENGKILKGDMTVDTLIVGGGICGILTAYELKQRGIDVILVEGNKLLSGQTKNTTAKITAQHGIIYKDIIKNFGIEKAQMYMNANQDAIKQYKSIIEKEKIDCNFSFKDAYLYSDFNVSELEEETKALQKLKIPFEYVTKVNLPFTVKGALKFTNQAQFHPLKFLHHIASKLDIYENCYVQSVEDNTAITKDAKIKFKNIVFATHFPFINFPGYYFLRMYQERSYVVALENAGKLNGMYLGIDESGLSLRDHKDLILLGGGKHRTGENNQGGKYEMLKTIAKDIFKDSKIKATWSAQDCITLDGIPYIGKFSSKTPNYYVATGFNKWGMSSSMVASKMISDMICGSENQYAPVFSPQRFSLSASAKSMLLDMGKTVVGLSKEVILPKENADALKAGEGGIVEVGTKKLGVYKDDDGNVYAVSPVCPHLGCQLEWNPDEKCFECPCHGSRFSYKGELIDNPAQTGLKVYDVK